MITNEEKDDLEIISDNNNLEKEIEGSPEIINDNKGDDSTYDYKFGWSGYSEITNGRFAMIGFLAIILIEIFSQKSFLNWAGLF